MTCLVIQFMLQKGWINNHYNIIIIITDFSFFSSFQPVQRKVTIVSVPFHFYKSSQCKNLACENIHFSLLFVAVDVSRRGTSATQQQKSHTDDANQCLHNKSGSHGVPNINLSNFACLWSILVKCCVHLPTSYSKTQMLLLEKTIFHKYWLFC